MCTYLLINVCISAVLLLTPATVSSVHGSDVEEVRYGKDPYLVRIRIRKDAALLGFRPHYRKLPRLPLPILAESTYAKRFDREDRDYKPLMFGKRAPDYMPPMFGKRGADYMPPVFG